MYVLMSEPAQKCGNNAAISNQDYTLPKAVSCF